MNIFNIDGRKMHILNLEPDDLVLESIVNFAKDNNIKNACIISGIGTLKKLHYHRILNTNYNPDNEYITLEGPFELSSVQGLIIDYMPHLHFIASDLNGTYSGHLEDNCVVLYLAEFLIVKLDDLELTRVPDERNVFFIKHKK